MNYFIHSIIWKCSLFNKPKSIFVLMLRSILMFCSYCKISYCNTFKNLFTIEQLPKNLDATDGLAAAVCHFYQKDIPDKGGGFNSWKDFLAKNPDRMSGG